MSGFLSDNRRQLFLLFALGVLASRFAGPYVLCDQKAMDLVQRPEALLLPSLLALICGSLATGKLWILLFSFLFGAQLSSLSVLVWSEDLHYPAASYLALSALSVLAFFLLAVLGMRSAGRLFEALRQSGHGEMSDAAKALIVRAGLFFLFMMGYSALV